ncbi:hypothetical protein Tco_1354510 [Tanacetum coccineum]
MAKRLCLVDDLKMLKITMSNTSSRNKLNPEINDHYNIFTGECQKDELKTQDKALNPVVHNAVQNLSVQNVGNHNGLIVVLGIANPNANQIGNGNVVAAQAEGDLDKIEEVNTNCILMSNLQQASTSGTRIDKALVYDSDGSAEVHEYDNFYNNEIFNMFTQEEQYTDLLEPIPEPHQVQQNNSDVISAVSSMERVLLEKHDPPVVYDSEETLKLAQESLFQGCLFLKRPRHEAAKFVRDFKSLAKEADESLAKHKALEFKIECLLRAVVSQDIMSIMQSNSNVDTSNLQTELYRMFRVNPFKTSREDKFVPINQVKASIMTNPITVSQPYIITKKDVNSDLNGLSSTGVDNTAKTRRPQPRSNTKNDRVPSASKSSCIKNKEVEVEEHHRNLLLSKNKKHMSSECNNKHKPKVTKTKKVGSKERLASPKPRKPRTYLRWSPTRRMFDLKGKLIESNESESQSDYSKGDNACMSNPQEPTRKRFPNFTYSLVGRPNLFMVRRLGMFKAYDRISKASHKFRLEVLGNRPLWK